MLKPLSETKGTVTLSRQSWNKILDRIDDLADRAALREFDAARKAGVSDALPMSLYRRLRTGEHPVRVWREHRGLGLNALAKASGVNASYLSEIENRAKPGSVAALKKLAVALKVDMDQLVR
jgi:ribosome-binding protein aMBF1 (putative translation factor)